MLPSQNRIDRQEGFRPVLKKGKRAANDVMVVSVSRFPGAIPPRAGIIVGKREFALATRRNRLKRRLRHLVGRRLESLPPGTSVVVRALGGAAELSSAELGANLDSLLATASRRAGISISGDARVTSVGAV